MATNERNLKLKCGRWTVDISFSESNGKLKRIRAAFPTKKEAQNYLALLRSQRAMRRLGFDVPETKREAVLFEDFAKAFISKHSLGRPATRRAHQVCLNALLRSDFFKGKRLSEVTTESIAKYHAERGAKHRVSANRELGFLKLIFKRAQDWGEVARNPAERVKKFTEQRNRLRILTDDEVARLLNAAKPLLKPLLLVLLTTGIRPIEAFALRWDYDGWDTEKKAKASIASIKKRVIFIPAALAKNHKDREVPLSNELVALLESLPRDGSGKVFPMDSAPKSFRAAVEGAKLKNVTLYTLKHTAASRMIRAGVDIVTVCELLGHADIKTTMIYCHSSAETKREAVARVSRIYARCSKKKAVRAEAPACPKPPVLSSIYN